MHSFRERASLAWRILTARPSALVDYAEREFDLVNEGEPFDEPFDYPQRFDSFQRHVRDLLLTFSTYGHSGSSAPFAAASFARLVQFKPLSPLTGDESEWMEIEAGTGPTWQNRRYGSVFRQQKIDAEVKDSAFIDARISHEFYDIDAIVYRQPDGLCICGPASVGDVTMPYEVPDQPTVIDVDEGGAPIPQPISLAPDLVERIEFLLPAANTEAAVIRGALAAARAQR